MFIKRDIFLNNKFYDIFQTCLNVKVKLIFFFDPFFSQLCIDYATWQYLPKTIFLYLPFQSNEGQKCVQISTITLIFKNELV